MFVATRVWGSRCTAQHLENHCGTIVHFSLDCSCSRSRRAALGGLSHRSITARLPALRSTTTTSLKIRPRAIRSRCLARRPSLEIQWISIRPVSMRRLLEPAAATTPEARLTFTVDAHAGHAISNIMFSEAGDTTLSGAGTDSTSTRVTANGTLTISEVDGAPIAPISRPIALTFTPSGGDYGLASDGGGLPIFHTQWTGSLAVNVGQILTMAGVPFSFGATELSVNLVNTLEARSQSGTDALINKHDFGGLSITVNIPEPASGVLLGVGLAGWFAAVRRPKCR